MLFLLIFCLTLQGLKTDFIDIGMEKMSTQFFGAVNYMFQKEEMLSIDKDVSFNLYTSKNPQAAQVIPPMYLPLWQYSYLNPNLKTYLVIHGYTDHKHREIIAHLRMELNKAEDANVIVVDWGRLAGFIYFNAVNNTPAVGRYVGEFLMSLEAFSIDLKNVHLIGHSLGAHISGIAGSVVGGRLGRITGLDPAGPLFEFIEIRDETQSLDSSDAMFVDILHTDGEEFGVALPIGHADFYPNEGTSPQPGCDNMFTVVSCSHIRAVDFYTESIMGSVPFEARSCKVKEDGPECIKENPVHMGHHVSLKARGLYFLETNARSPFAKGRRQFE